MLFENHPSKIKKPLKILERGIPLTTGGEWEREESGEREERGLFYD